MAALAAAVQMTAERSSAAVRDGEKHAKMQPSQPGPALLDEAIAMCTDDIGHLERWPGHFLCNLRDRFTWSRLDSSALSSGVPAARTIPHELSWLALQNKKVVYDLLFRASAVTLLEIAADPKHLGADIGFLSVLHTWGQNLRGSG